MRRALLLAIPMLMLAPCPCQQQVAHPPVGVVPADGHVVDPPIDAAGAHAAGAEDGAQPVPEPSTLLLVGTALVGVALTTRTRRRRRGYRDA